jgi:uncharacterized membrane-anchored protein
MHDLNDHPLRYHLANELHARPFPEMGCPATLVFVAIKRPAEAVSDDRSAERAHLLSLLDRHGAPHPQPDATHFSGKIGRHVLKWEQHTEFVTYTAYHEALSERPFDPAEFEIFPADWMANAPGDCVSALHIRIMGRATDDTISKNLNDWFVAESVAVSSVLDAAAVIAGDFRIDPSGAMRFAVFVDDATGRRRVGRIAQRLCEIETYKSMSMLGFARARGLMDRIGAMDARLTELTVEMTANSKPAEQTLTPLLETASELEAISAREAYRFGATQAYEAIVTQRVEVLREARFQGRQTFSEFMQRRYQPAMRTVTSIEARLERLAYRAMRAGELLRTRVDVERSAQNQALLASMDQRADLQLRLQETVEGLSVVAISYYAVSLAGYLMYPLATGLGVSKGMMTAVITVPVVAGVWWMVRRIKNKMGH